MKVFKTTTEINGKMVDEVITNLFNFTLKDNALDWCKTTQGNFLTIKLWIWSRFFTNDIK